MGVIKLRRLVILREAKRSIWPRLAVVALLVLVLVLGASAQSVHRHRRHHLSHARPANVGALRGRLQSVRSKKAALRAQLRKTRKQAHAVLGDIHVVDQRLSDVKDRLQDTTDRLTESRAEQIKIGRELDAATQRVGVVREQVRRRLRAMYVHGTTSPLTAMVGCDSVGEVVSRGYLMRTVARKDQALFTEYKALRVAVADHKEKQDRLVKDIHLLALRQTAQTHELAQARQDKQEILRGLRAKQSDLEASIAQFDEDEREIGAEIASFSRRSRPSGGQALPVFTGNLSMPVEGARITDPFGMRYHPILHRYRMHEGVDLAAPEGTPIHAAADGQVIATTYLRGYGNVVILDHGGGVSTVYAHCSRILCSVGQQVRRGETVAAVGMTGLATGPHCHFELRINNHPVNPLSHM